MKQREHKYRAWDTKEKKMLSAEDLMSLPASITPDGSGFACLHHCSSASNIYYPELIPLEYMEKKDINGKEICEGDIVRDGSFLMIIENDGFNWLSTIIGERDDEDGRTAILDRDDIKKFEVVGNKYENKNLLK